jgi:hypothetical protein
MGWWRLFAAVSITKVQGFLVMDALLRVHLDENWNDKGEEFLLHINADESQIW